MTRRPSSKREQIQYLSGEWDFDFASLADSFDLKGIMTRAVSWMLADIKGNCSEKDATEAAYKIVRGVLGRDGKDLAEPGGWVHEFIRWDGLFLEPAIGNATNRLFHSKERLNMESKGIISHGELFDYNAGDTKAKRYAKYEASTGEKIMDKLDIESWVATYGIPAGHVICLASTPPPKGLLHSFPGQAEFPDGYAIIYGDSCPSGLEIQKAQAGAIGQTTPSQSPLSTMLSSSSMKSILPLAVAGLAIWWLMKD